MPPGKGYGGRRRKPATTIGRGRKGTVKRAAFTAGVGRKGLKTLRSLSPEQRVMVAAGMGRGLRRTVRAVRETRARSGRSMTTGKRTGNIRERTKGARVAQRAAARRTR